MKAAGRRRLVDSLGGQALRAFQLFLRLSFTIIFE